MTDRTASQNTLAFRDLPADIQAASLDAVGHMPRPMSHMEMLLAVGQAILAERERDGWRSIDEDAPAGTLLLYFPPETTPRGDYKHAERIKVDMYPVSYPRKPTHWRPLPNPPAEGGEQP